MTKITVLDALDDPALFGRQFEGDSWRAWRAFLAALFGLSLEGQARKIYRKHTGRRKPPRQPFGEAYAIVGRRGGKSRIAALIGVFLACFRDYSAVLGPGERGTVMILAADRKQARVCMNYVRGLLEGVPLLADLVVTQRRESIDLRNRISIEVHTASYRSVRGYTVVATILDELAFWRSEESADPDVEVVRALRPAMATVPGAVLLGISSPYARRGVLWEAFDRHHGNDRSDVLVWRGTTRAMNPLVDRKVVAEAYEADPVAAAAEYGAEFRRDIEGYISREVLAALLVPGRHELPPVKALTYRAFVDPSGGSRDSMTLAIAHKDGERAVLDLLRERRPPFSPDDVVAEFAGVLRAYRLSTVVGDRYAGEWPRERFRKRGITYRVAESPKSDIYRDLLPLLNAGRVELLDHRRLTVQLLNLERRTARGGRDTIDHPPGGHDDLANAAAGALVSVLSPGVVGRKAIRVTWGE